MAVFNEPTKWQTSLVNSGDANTIPQNTPVGTGKASFDDGFPQITQVPIGAGGIAPDRKDFNGLFKILGDWIFFNQNGGVSTYSENFDYVAGRVVLYNDNIYKCIQANGVSSTVVTPDSNTEYWLKFALNNELADYLPLTGGNLTGNLTVQNKNVVRSVNGVNADNAGNVNINTVEVESMLLESKGYIRYSNGIQLCWDDGSNSQYTINKTLTFIKPFYDTNYALIGVGFVISSSGAQSIDNRTTTSFRTTSNTSLAGTLSYLAIGRWK